MDKIERIYDELGSLVYHNFKPSSMEFINSYNVKRIDDSSIDSISYSVRYRNKNSLLVLIVSYIATESDISAFWETRDDEEFILKVSTENNTIREITSSIHELRCNGDKLFRDFSDIICDYERQFRVINLKPISIKEFVNRIVEKISGDETNLSDKIRLLSSQQLAFKILHHNEEYNVELYFDSKCGVAALSDPKECAENIVEFVVRRITKENPESKFHQVQLTVSQILELDEDTVKILIDLF